MVIKHQFEDGSPYLRAEMSISYPSTAVLKKSDPKKIYIGRMNLKFNNSLFDIKPIKSHSEIKGNCFMAFHFKYIHLIISII